MIVIKTLQGLEPVLAAELETLGATDIQQLKRAVSCSGDERLLYRANYELRTALRVLLPFHSFRATNEKEFYKAVREVDWNKYMDVTDTLAVHTTVSGDFFTHSQYVSLLTKDAIVDQFRDRFQRRPNVSLGAPTLQIQVRIYGSNCDLLLDSSGDSLHKRGYRSDTGEAPLNEVLAAGMILLTGWQGESSFVDPMCGSGTLPIEAAMIAMRMPPQRQRPAFGFTRWKTFNEPLWNEVKAAADAQALSTPPFPIFGYDIDSRARNAALINVMTAGLEKEIQFERKDFERLVPPEPPGIMVVNPPYDERLKLEEAEAFYKGIGDRLKQAWPGWDAWLISSNMEAWKRFGLRPSRKIALVNGSLDCYFQKFEMYAGKKHG